MIERWGRPEQTALLLLSLFVLVSWLPWWATANAWQDEVCSLGVVTGVVAMAMWLAHRAQPSQPDWLTWVAVALLATAFLLCAHRLSLGEPPRPSTGLVRTDDPGAGVGGGARTPILETPMLETRPGSPSASPSEAPPAGPRGALLLGLALLAAEGAIVMVTARKD
ncbi:hypothetical protein LX15_005546 [Streptoalloteichus tenebrarius]|uniref:Uncharacterized protein n=1 Tax=Streptoalloteichus tenebrarius (strain ATCC 17920 / DSM 40477 / JCM 4838 / CBS 697.72 / NBRC 16177 / NCIMB 11028 / NRRL B-12390 / A12253. 1 / ISP 5477) TaxID=1933 RepID=A0ABT1I235_STRSD|nr:hypothetical protein [Streptoalloteichus tenebrarius]MCP2261819.1 hypothetical protein [Streptoalloteichus tenebrarius]BFF02197.1 hypothetical protein GCM10020241_38720 [Streptoalloteichus tenebrarius]